MLLQKLNKQIIELRDKIENIENNEKHIADKLEGMRNHLNSLIALREAYLQENEQFFKLMSYYERRIDHIDTVAPTLSLPDRRRKHMDRHIYSEFVERLHNTRTDQ